MFAWSGWGRAQEAPDAAGEVAIEAADGFAVGLAFGGLAASDVSRVGGSGRG